MTMVEPTKCEEAPRTGTFRALRGTDPSARGKCVTDSMIPVSSAIALPSGELKVTKLNRFTGLN